ncbi:MAG: VCBS repeat-containing protein, partial [Myxococcota bacterium]
MTFPDTNQRIQAEGTATGASAQVPARFVVDDGYGVRSVYETRVLAPRPRYVDANGQIPVTDETVVYRWLLTYREDHYGNRIEYRYHEEEASTVHIELEPDLRFAVEYWLERIEYTSNPSAGLAARRAIRFEYERRPDPVDSFVSGVHRRHSHLLKRIVMEAPNPSAVEDVWSYVLNYERQEQNGVSAGRSRLSSLTRCDQFGGCQAPTRFEWAAPEPVFGAPEPQNINRWNDVEQQPELQTADFNGDGFDDLLFWRGDVDACEWSSGIGDWTWGGRETSDGIGNCDPDRDGSRVIGRWLIAYSDGHSLQQPEPLELVGCFETRGEPADGGNVFADAVPRDCPGAFSPLSDPPDESNPPNVIDLDGDGAADWITAREGVIRLSGGGAADAIGSTYQTEGPDKEADVRLFGDFNGDGIIDLVTHEGRGTDHPDEMKWYLRFGVPGGGFASTRRSMTLGEPGEGWAEGTDWRGTIEVVDIDGDGRSELLHPFVSDSHFYGVVEWDEGDFVYSRLNVGIDPDDTGPEAIKDAIVDRGSPNFVDINGDGL